ncbi:rac GTPase-activating protein 1-like [Venturia canescens]|uniref:rac GTPase-activating protein 1-like n=1 Tax=Venturia canescens TaxID=32260 RepID=UPI001C9CC69A|nr:rac GTPase-activating protein 1-like [Venturia canescens]
MDRGSSIGNFRRGFVSNPMGITPSHATARRLAYGEEMSRAEPATTRANIGSSELCSRKRSNLCSSLHHELAPRMLLKKELCFLCEKILSFGKVALRCARCNEVRCIECKAVPRKSNGSAPSTSGRRDDSKKFADYAPNEPPFVPSLILHCIEAIRSHGMKNEGLYQQTREPDVVTFLVEEFSNGKIPDLSEVPISAICSTLLRFMRSLSEPLVTFELRDEFIRAALISKKGGGNGALLTVISKLPRVNRDTLAYLILHLQQVSRSPECAMSVDKLARIFGPTLLAYGDIELTDETLDIETEKQYEVFRRLMSISAHEWARFINFEALENRLMRETRTTISPATSTSDLDDDDMF